MNNTESNKSFMIETVRNDVRRYLEYYRAVYSKYLSVEIPEFKLRYKLRKLQPALKTIDEVNALSLAELKIIVSGCTKCGLSSTRKNIVFGSGSDKEKLVIIGEAPGADEDESGEPFVGRAGQLLTKMLSAIGIERENVFICNVLKCRPPNNRDPLPDEIAKCSGYLDKQLEFLKPKYILALGRIAAVRLLNKESTMKDLREKIHSYKGIPVIVTYHPSALLRNPNWKYPAWDDLKKLKELLDKANE